MKFSLIVVLLTLLLCDRSFSHTHQLHNKEDGSINERYSKHLDGEHDPSFDHEAILGSTKDAEEFDNLTPQEGKKRLEVLMVKMDTDGDRKITREELKKWILRSFRMLTEEESEENFDEVDIDEDGFVSWKEFIAETYDIKDDADLQELENNDKKLFQDDKETFDAADINNDGRLSKEEFVAFSHPEEEPHMLDHLLKQNLKQKDKDGDGMINFQEFVADKTEQGGELSQEALLAENERFKNEYDKDGDQVLNKNEILEWIAPSNDIIADEEVVHLFEEADDDSDDVLSFDEILSHYDVFAGSEATDYGDHLHNLERFDDEL